MKKRMVQVTFALLFAFSFFATTYTVQANYDRCSTSVGSSSTCTNNLEVNDGLAYFKNVLKDTFSAPSAYNIKFTMSEFRPSVTRGSPIYKTFWIMDNFNSDMIHYSDTHNGKFLNDYSSLVVGSNKTAGYYPKQEPTTTLAIQNASPLVCSSEFWNCATYNQASTFFVK